ncbi:MAG: hypothetical protein FWD61_17660 [Phycisphaerales bacterium]|nr:hypothetical protein [Phycisphaerales bacterium]
MKKFRLLLLDANIVIELFRLGVWDKIIARCDIHIAKTVVRESHFYRDANGNYCSIDLAHYINTKSITEFNVARAELDDFRSRFSSTYFDKLDPGETESLGYLLRQSEQCQICSADAIVFRVLGNLGRSAQGVSMEEMLNAIGMSRQLEWKFTRNFREHWTKKGFQEGLGGAGMKRDGR